MPASADPNLVGSTISHYKILEKLGAGGMGVVYRALDTTLDRTVALKLLPVESIDPGRKKRFVQEAKSASALNHPNIVTIYEIGSAQGQDFIAMEYVQGRTLDALIARKPMPLAAVLKYTVQIADGLTAAHEAGIVHRDLKPGNIMANAQGAVKILDFGLAKLTDRSDSSPLGEETQTVLESGPRTEEGVIVGTVSYMSPEQTEGKPLDARSDIFSFGSVLYEMLTGRRAFKGDTSMSTMTAILRDDPQPVSQTAEIPPHDLEKILNRCLRKDPSKRFQHMADLKVALEELKEDSDSGRLPVVSGGGRARPRRWGLAAALAAAILVAAGAGFWLWKGRTPKPRVALPMRRLTFDTGVTSGPAISPDGKLVAYYSRRGGGQNNIWVQQVASGDAVQLTHDPDGAVLPGFSPDGSKIVYEGGPAPKSIFIISTLGGEPRKLASPGHYPSFSPDGNFVAYTADVSGGTMGLFVVPVTAGEPRRLQPGFFSVGTRLVWSPDSKHILFGAFKDITKIKNLVDFDWWVTSVDGGEAIRTGASRSLHAQGVVSKDDIQGEAGVWIGDKIIFSDGRQDSKLWQVAISPRDWQIAGPATQITSGANRDLRPSVSASGDLVFSSVSTNDDFWLLPLDADRGKVTGEIQPLIRNSASDNFSVSMDGAKMVFCSRRSGNSDVWIKYLDSGKETTLVATPADEHAQMGISGDGSKVGYYSSTEGDVPIVYVADVAGGAPQKLGTLVEFNGLALNYAGSELLYVAMSNTKTVFLKNLASGATRTLWENVGLSLDTATFSADDRWIAAFFAGDAGSYRGFVIPVRDHPVPESDWIPITDGKSGDRHFHWSPNGNMLYFVSNRDTNQCVWAQGLDPVTKHPSGAPFAVHHVHSTGAIITTDIGVAKDKLILHLTQNSSNIYLTKLPE